MKKWVALLLALVLMVSCTAALADTYGLGSVTGRSDTNGDKDEGKNGQAQFNTTMAAVALNDEGKFIWVKIDVAQNTVQIDYEGQVVPAADLSFPTKEEKKEAYNMKATSAGRGNITVNAELGGEWYEQAAFFEEYCVGKTLEEVITGIAMVENYPTAPDVIVGITIHINEFIEALEKAVANAK
jgi:hypothetical protein